MRTLACFAALRGLWAVLIHANVRFPLPRLPRGVAGRAGADHGQDARDSGNYSNVSSRMDAIFATFHGPEYEPMPRSYLGLLTHPFRGRPADPPNAAGD